MSNFLEKLKKREAAYIYDLAEIKKEIKAEQLRISKEQYGVFIGVDVIRHGHIYRVTEINTRPNGEKPFIYGVTKGSDRVLEGVTCLLADSWEIAT